MYRRYGFVVITSALLASGCTQTVRHTNTLLFATNSQIALSAGTNATTQPEVTFGYKRQEVVVMPLVANYAPDKDKPENYIPCGSPTSPPPSTCFIVGKNGASGAQDSYSVLASFGAKFGGRTNGTAPEASVGIAQYFATGVAAQLLAATGGASVISTAAQQPASPERAAVVAAVMNPDDAQRAALGVANYDQAVEAGIAAGLKRNLIAANGASCFKDAKNGPKLLAGLQEVESLKGHATKLEAAGKESADALSRYLLDLGTAAQRDFSNQILTHC
ncbi:hypothetical protein [Aquidulcibacter sp.]|uniref:hypothetical protein n=1 Tax=Aquidulcibacter sp. TaxID=2052990 RepID=UPI0025C3F729|nr:hypothetical protein [Aquidulcibacter sp.]MCA3697857.1 hypothetical protein [Aquidulcibacter sp.]